MGALESNTTLIYGIHIRESANDGSDFSNGASDYRVLFLGEDGFLHVKDSAGTVTDPYDAGGGGGNPVVYDIERYTGGDIGVTSTTTGAAVPSMGSVTVAAASGDLVMLGVSIRTEGSAIANSTRFDVGTIVSAAVVNYVSSLSGTASAQGISAWFHFGSEEYPMSGEVPYVVQAGDISGGNVEFSLRAWLSGAGTHTLAADSDAPLLFWVRNLGQ